ncbi:MAG: hypothetical protein M0P64_01795 [Candidatus Pacebacteria bacterium]|nr:hypothetical protein [Candidatus Paceibacterota bacterium]
MKKILLVGLFLLLPLVAMSAPFLDHRDPLLEKTIDLKSCAVEKSYTPLALFAVGLVSLFVYKKKRLNQILWHEVRVAKMFVLIILGIVVFVLGKYLLYLAYIISIPTNYISDFDPTCGAVITCENLKPCHGRNAI